MYCFRRLCFVHIVQHVHSMWQRLTSSQAVLDVVKYLLDSFSHSMIRYYYGSLIMNLVKKISIALGIISYVSR